MTSIWRGRGLLGALLLGCVLLISMPPGFAEEDPYTSYSFTGRLAEEKSGKPLANATVRFISTEPSGETLETVTDANGEFTIQGLEDVLYVVTIETAKGKRIKGMVAERVAGTDRVEIVFSRKTKKHVDTILDAGTLQVDIEKERNWKRFWGEFGIWLGAAIVAGALVL